MPEQTYVISQSEGGSVSIAADVLQSIIMAAINEVEGVAGLATAIGSDVAEYLGIKSVPKGIRVVVNENGAMNIDVVLLVRYSYNVGAVAEQVQEHVIASVNAITGMKAVVNVHVTGISFEKAER